VDAGGGGDEKTCIAPGIFHPRLGQCPLYGAHTIAECRS
jgi:hypothetical protein